MTDDLRYPLRYNAACLAVQASFGQGQDAANLDEAERSRLRQQALKWLREDLDARSQPRNKEGDAALPLSWLRHWQEDSDLAGVRGEALAKLPEAERKAWQQLWTDLDQALRKVNTKHNGDVREPERR